MLGHARHLHVEYIMSEALLRGHSALDRGERGGEELSLRLELAPERENLGFEKTFKLGRFALRKPQNNCIRLRHRIVFGRISLITFAKIISGRCNLLGNRRGMREKRKRSEHSDP